MAELIRSDSIAEASVGLATINALLDVDEASCVEVNAEDILIKEGLDKRVVIVGHFPFVPRVRQVAKELWVLERYPRGEDLPATRAEEIVPPSRCGGDYWEHTDQSHFRLSVFFVPTWCLCARHGWQCTAFAGIFRPWREYSSWHTRGGC